jgi:hypothetical protein
MAGLAEYSEYFANPLFTQIINETNKPDQVFIGERFLPEDTTYEVDWNETIMDHGRDMADIVNGLSELPLTDSDPMRRVSGEIADIGQSYIVTKKEMQDLKYKGNNGRQKVAIKNLLNKGISMKENVKARMEWMRWQVLGTGKMSYAKGNMQFTVDFGVPAGNIVTPVKKFNATDSAFIADYEANVQKYVDLNGFKPNVTETSSAVIRAILNDTTVRQQITGYSAKLLTLEELNTFLKGRELPPLEAYDTVVVYRDLTSKGVRASQRLLDPGTMVMLREGGDIGKQLLGPTLENDMNPGIFGRTFTENRPLRNVMEVVAASFPKVLNPEYIFIMKNCLA